MTITIDGTTGITNDGGYTGDGVVFADTTPANTLVTTTGGLVGMGAASPSQKLHVVGNTLIPLTNSYHCYTTDYGIGTPDSSGLQIFTGSGDSLRFGKRPSGTFTEFGRFDSSGNLLVGKTSTGSAAGLTLYGQSTISGYGRIDFSKTVTGTVTGAEFSYNGTPVGTITYSNTATAYNTSSDYRLKNTIAPMTGALAKVAALKPCTYKWNVDGSDGQGFIAHEMQAVVPDAVTGEKDAVDADGKPVYQGIDTSFLVATLTAAIQEQQAIILAQQTALTALTARVAALEGTQP